MLPDDSFPVKSELQRRLAVREQKAKPKQVSKKKAKDDQ